MCIYPSKANKWPANIVMIGAVYTTSDFHKNFDDTAVCCEIYNIKKSMWNNIVPVEHFMDRSLDTWLDPDWWRLWKEVDGWACITLIDNYVGREATGCPEYSLNSLCALILFSRKKYINKSGAALIAYINDCLHKVDRNRISWNVHFFYPGI